MRLTDSTFKKMIGVLRETYTDWKLSTRQEPIWKYTLTSKISDEILPRIVSEWISNEATPPKTPADLVHYLDKEIKKQFDSADVSATLIIDSARDAYYATDEFESFSEAYIHSFAYMVDARPTQEAYVIDSIQKHSSSPKILILVYDELKGEVQDCFTGDAEHGVEFLRNHIKKSWNVKVDEAAKQFLKSGNTDIGGLTGGNRGMLEG